ncbi:hypothetical protein ACE1AT_23350 [Pelatocladus sp. BLCC-F211]|uniref:hypothetical protein n=1 Tax=Pelatocladus sp. BLCC-F211 TaxID=3342752 RepID=UPI0035BA20D7
MDKELQNSFQNFTALKSKYHASRYEDSSSSSLLYLILQKVDLGIKLTTLEFDWLTEHQLLETVEAISQEEKRRVEELKKLEKEFSHLKNQYKVPNFWQGFKDDISVPLYPILWKLNSEKQLNQTETKWLQNHQLVETLQIVHEMELSQHFLTLKTKYKAIKSQESSSQSPLYAILKKLETKTLLTKSELEWLKHKELLETIDIVEQQNLEKQADFAYLKEKYQAVQYHDVSISSSLYPILQKLDSDKKLIYSEIYWLEQQGLIETLAIANELEQKREFTALKAKYKASQYEDSSPLSHLYKVLKRLDLDEKLSEQDINFLKNRKLTETLAIAHEKYASNLKSNVELGKLLTDTEIDWLKNHEREDIINLAHKKQYVALKKKYGLLDPGNQLPLEPFYTIMIKLERKERLDPLLLVQLIEKGRLSGDGNIAIAHYSLEADFYEQEFKRTGNKWHIPTASSYWRKADEPEKALNITNLDLGKIRESKLQSAILVTRGAAFRDIGDLVNAEKSAKKAIEFHPESYQPYTLMGAIYYDKSEYSKGDYWFTEAEKRGAKTDDVDDEIKRVLRSTKDEIKRQQAVNYLLKKDSQRYAWAKCYLKKSQKLE